MSVAAAGAYFGHLQAAGRSELTIRSYGMDLLRWFRFLWAIGVPWDHAVRSDARDFCRWLQVAGKPVRPHWREQDRHGAGQPAAASGVAYSPSVRAHCETVLRSFYDFHVEAGTGPLVNPFPLDRSRRGGRAHAHHNPMEPFRSERSGRYRPAVPSRIPRSVPDEEFNEIFAALGSHRDRALVAFYVSTGARASELLSATRGGVDPGRQLITVVRKGTRELAELPASVDAFVWLRLYQLEMEGKLPRGGSRQPLWWTLRRPFRPLTYHAVHRMFERAGAAAGTDATLHSLRHTAAYRMAERSGSAADRRAVRARSCPADHHAAVSDAPQGGGDPPGAGPSRRAGPPGPAAGPAGSRPGLPARDAGRAVRGRPVVTARGAGGAASALARRLPGRAGPLPAAAGGGGLAGHPAGPGPGARPAGRRSRQAGVMAGRRLLLDWLEDQDGDSWQQRWLASGAEQAGTSWWQLPARWPGSRDIPGMRRHGGAGERR